MKRDFRSVDRDHGTIGMGGNQGLARAGNSYSPGSERAGQGAVTETVGAVDLGEGPLQDLQPKMEDPRNDYSGALQGWVVEDKSPPFIFPTLQSSQGFPYRISR